MRVLLANQNWGNRGGSRTSAPPPKKYPGSAPGKYFE